MSGVSWFLLVSLIAGWLAGLLVKGGWFGVIEDITIGAMVGGFLFESAGAGSIGRPGSLLVATIGGAVMIFFLRVIRSV